MNTIFVAEDNGVLEKIEKLIIITDNEYEIDIDSFRALVANADHGVFISKGEKR